MASKLPAYAYCYFQSSLSKIICVLVEVARLISVITFLNLCCIVNIISCMASLLKDTSSTGQT